MEINNLLLLSNPINLPPSILTEERITSALSSPDFLHFYSVQNLFRNLITKCIFLIYKVLAHALTILSIIIINNFIMINNF